MDELDRIKIYVALIAGAASLIVSIIAMIKSVRVSHLSAESAKEVENIRASAAKELEALKIKSHKREKSLEMAAEQARQIASCVDDIWSHLQRIKESIDQLDSPVGGSRERSLKEIAEEDAMINEIYSSVGGKLPEDMRVIAHDIKNMTRAFSAALNTVYDTDIVTDRDNSGFESRIEAYRNSFTRFQESLKCRKAEYIERKADEIYIKLINNKKKVPEGSNFDQLR